MARRVHGINVGGEGRKAEIDGGYFGGYVKPAKHVENRRDRRLRQYQSGKRKDVVVIGEREARHCLMPRSSQIGFSDCSHEINLQRPTRRWRERDSNPRSR